MRHARFIAIAIAAAATITFTAGAGASAKSVKKTKFDCTLELFAQGAPNPSGIHFGFPSCPRPFGRGVHYNRYTVTPTGDGRGTVAGEFKNYYNLGTTRGTVAMTFTATTGPMNITYTGTVTYTGGTGAFKGVKGKGTIQCTTTDRGAHKSCTVNSTLTGV